MSSKLSKTRPLSVFRCEIEEIDSQLEKFWTLCSTKERSRMICVDKYLVVRKLKNNHKHRCSCDNCLHKKVSYFDDNAQLYDKIVEILKARSEGERPNDECAVFYIFGEDLKIEGNNVVVNSERLKSDRFDTTLSHNSFLTETLRKRVQNEANHRLNLQRGEPMCEMCRACFGFECLLCNLFLDQVKEVYENSRASIKADLMLLQLLKEEEETAKKLLKKKTRPSARPVNAGTPPNSADDISCDCCELTLKTEEPEAGEENPKPLGTVFSQTTEEDKITWKKESDEEVPKDTPPPQKTIKEDQLNLVSSPIEEISSKSPELEHKKMTADAPPFSPLSPVVPKPSSQLQPGAPSFRGKTKAEVLPLHPRTRLPCKPRPVLAKTKPRPVLSLPGPPVFPLPAHLIDEKCNGQEPCTNFQCVYHTSCFSLPTIFEVPTTSLVISEGSLYHHNLLSV